MNVTCDKCGELFAVRPSDIDTISSDGYEVQYFSCPRCGSSYHVMTTNERMRQLIGKHVSLAQKIKIAHMKHFKESSIRGYVQELASVENEQRLLLPALKRRGMEILKSKGDTPNGTL